MYKTYRTYIIAHIILLFTIIFQVPTNAATIEEVRPIVENYYIEDVHPDLFEQSIEELFNSLDSYSKFLSDEELQQFENNINQSFVGIGIVFTMEDEGAHIEEVLLNSPAADAGLQVDDLIIEVDGTSLIGKTSVQTSNLILGHENTTVDLVVLRNGTKINITVTRGKVNIPIVTTEVLGENIGYMKIQSFSNQLIETVKNEKQRYADVDGWIIDVRNNGGGYLESAQTLLGMFEDVKYTLKAQFKHQNVALLTHIQDEFFTQPISLLINRNSASASEIVAAALKDYEKATLYGETTFGKGRMQNVYSLPSGGAVVLTVATFRSPLGNEIDEVGVEPDIKTVTPLEDAHWDQLDSLLTYKVLDHLKNIPVNHHFRITLNSDVDLKNFREKVNLVTLGAKEVDFEIVSIGNHQYELIPAAPLEPGGEYAILIHEGWENEYGKTAQNGTMVRVSVEQ